MKPKSTESTSKSASLIAVFAVLLAQFAAPSVFAAGPFYWDNNGTTTGFGTAGGTWSATTTGSSTLGWSTDSTGATLPGTVTTATTDTSESFGTGVTGGGLAAGTVTVGGAVSSGNIIFGSLSGAITLSGGTSITLPAAASITVNNSAAVDTISTPIAGGGTSMTISGAGTLALGANNTFGNVTFGSTAGPVIQATATHALGGGTITLNGGSLFIPRLELSGGITLANAITLNGRASTTGIGTVGIRNVSGNNTLSGAVSLTVNGNQWTIQADAGTLTMGTAGSTALQSLSGARTPTFQGSGNGAVVGNMVYSGTTSVGAIIAGPGTWTFSGANTCTNGTTLNAGQLNINYGGSSSANSAIGGGSPNFFTIAGGAIDNTSAGDVLLLPTIAQNWNGDFTYVGSVHNLNLGAGAVTLNATRQVTVSAGTLTVGGAIGGGATFGLTKAGAGTLVLSASSGYTGATTINGGTLQVGGSGDINACSGITVNGSGAKYLHTSTTASTRTITQTLGTVDGSGTLATVNLANNAANVVQNGNGTSAALTVGTLAFNGAATINAAQSGVSGTSPINATTLTTTPGSGTITVNATIAGGGWSSSTTYNLVHSSSTLILSDFTKGAITGLTSRQSATLVQVDAHTIGVQINGDSPKWTGLDSTSWVIGTSGGSGNWKLITGGTATDYAAGDTVLFDDSAASASTVGSVTISVADVSPTATTFNNSSGGIATYTVSGAHGIASGSLTKNNTGTLALNTVNSYTGGTLINGGILSFLSGALSSSGTIDFTGNATLQWGSGNTQDLSSRLKLEDGITATIDTGANAVPFASALTLGSLQTAAVTKAGSGTLTLSASTAYTGATTINAGTLTVSGSGAINSSSGITINGSSAKYVHTSSAASTRTITQTLGTVDGTGTLGTVSVANNSANVVQHGNGATTTLTIGTLAFGGAATVNIARSASATTPEINVTGALSTTPANGQVIINVSAGSWANGTTYNLVGCGTKSFNLSDFTLGTITGLTGTQNAALVLNGNNIALQISNVKWTGLDSTSWVVGTTGANDNWALINGGTPANYADGEAVLFDDTASSAVTPGVVAISAANVNPATTTFNNSSAGISPYAVSGSFGIASGSLTKNNNGTLALNTANTYSGGTTINGGTVQAGNDSSLGAASGTLTFGTSSSGKLQVNAHSITVGGLSGDATATIENANASAGTLTVNSAATLTYSGTVQDGTGGGTLALIKNGAGTLNLSATNTYGGGTTISNGVVNANVNNCLGTGAVTFNGGVRLVLANGVTITNAITIGANAGGAGRDIIEAASSSTVTLTGAITINNAAAGGGHFGCVDTTSILNLQGPITVNGSGYNLTQRAGTVVYGGGGTYTNVQINQDKVVVGANNGIATTAYFTNNFGASGPVTFDLNGFNQTIAGISRFGANAATITNSSTTADSTLTVNGNSSFGGTIVDSGTGTKVNLAVSGGAFTLTNNNTYRGTTVINGGTLALSGSGAIPNSSGVTVGSGATFDVSGLTTALALGSGQVLNIGASGANVTGTINTSSGKGLTLSAGGLMFTAYAGGATAPLTVAGADSLLLNGAPVTVTTATALTAGTYKIIAKGGAATVSGTPGALTVNGSGLAAGTTATLQLISGELWLNVSGNISFTGTPAAFSTTYGTASSAQSFSVSGSGLTGNLVATAPAGFEVSGNGVTYGSSTSFTTSGGSASGTLAVRLAATAAVGNYNSQNIVLSGAGANNVNITTTSSGNTVNPASTFVGASSTVNPSGYKDSISFIATLPADASGSVVFSSTNGPISTNTISSGSATSFSITNLLRGTNLITIAYLGDGNYVGSTNTLDQIVTNHPPVAADAAYYRAKGISLKIALTDLFTNVTEVDGDTLTLQSVGAGLTNATITTDSNYVYYLSGTGSGSNDNDIVSYTVSDGFGGTATANIFINVYSATGQAQMSIPTNGVVNITFFGIPNYTYVVQTTTNLSVPWWTLSTNTAGTNGIWLFTDPNATNAQQYYRSAQP